MKIIIKNMHIFSKDGEEDIFNFSESVNFIYGNVGTGKTTILNLIMYGLGGKMINTPAIKKCFKAVQLEILLNDMIFKFFRIANSNRIQIDSLNDNHRISINTSNISDFLFEKCNLPIRFQSTGNYEGKDIKLTFQNYSWFSYLKQSEMDNSFFNLHSDNMFKQNAAVDVMLSFLESDILVDRELNKYYKEQKRRLRQYEDNKQVFKYVEDIFYLKNSSQGENVSLLIDSLKGRISKLINSKNLFYSEDIHELLELQKDLVLVEQKRLFENKKNRYFIELDTIRANIEKYEKNMKDEFFEHSYYAKNLYEIFLECLHKIEFQGINKYDTIKIDHKTHMPIITNEFEGKELSFENISSGGRKTLFKICFALAIHRFQHTKMNKNYLPSFLFIDTPMKNISEREDSNMYDNFYKYLFDTFSTELEDTQLFVIDKEKRNLTDYHFKDEAFIMRMTHDDKLNPPLFKNYRE